MDSLLPCLCHTHPWPPGACCHECQPISSNGPLGPGGEGEEPATCSGSWEAACGGLESPVCFLGLSAHGDSGGGGPWGWGTGSWKGTLPGPAPGGQCVWQVAWCAGGLDTAEPAGVRVSLRGWPGSPEGDGGRLAPGAGRSSSQNKRNILKKTLEIRAGQGKGPGSGNWEIPRKPGRTLTWSLRMSMSCVYLMATQGG